MFIQVISYGGFSRMKLSKEVLNIEPEFVEKRVLKFIRARVTDVGVSGVVMGLSGGIDSSVVAALCVKALGPERVLGLMLPEKDSDPNDIKDAVKIAKQLENPYEVVDITSIINACPGNLFKGCLGCSYSSGKCEGTCTHVNTLLLCK